MYTGRSRRTLFMTGAVVILASAGCSSDVDGTAEPDEPGLTSVSQQAKVSQLPQRPSEVSLAGVDPCTLLSRPQLDELQINSIPRQAADPVDGPTCVLDADKVEPFHTYHVRTVPADLEEWLTGKRRKTSMTTEPKQLGGFPAITNHRDSGSPADCETLVGTAAGQTLAVQAFTVTAGAYAQQQLCEMSARAAEMALQTAKARK
jgi:hypothetical protein